MGVLQTLSRDKGTNYRESFIPSEDEFSEDGLAVSEEEYWEKYYTHNEINYEWKNGYLEAIPMSDLKGSRTHQWFCEILNCYFTTYSNGIPVSLEIGFRFELPGETCVRVPDIGIVMNDNPVAINDDDRSYKGIFDLCVESLSHSEKKHITRDTDDKKKEYEGGGVREYYILDARGIETAFCRLDKRGKYRKIGTGKDGIVRSAVLPGFQFRISDLYTQPSLEEMAEDEIYNKYVLPSYKKVKKRAEQEEKRAEQEKERAEQEKERAEQEKKRAEQAENLLSLEKYQVEKTEKQLTLEKKRVEQEKQRSERLAEKLRSLGISPEEI
ncbi:MAG: Uma2 family endonuclease [Desulfobacterales bacterium]|nr:Uma2 family endonuclease [Desulfobacterales bacterium]